MRAYEFITEDVPIHDLAMGPDIHPDIRNRHDSAISSWGVGGQGGGRDSALTSMGGGGISGGGVGVRQARAIQNTAPSGIYPKSGATGSTTSPLAHDTTPVIPINIKRVTTFEPPQKVQGNKLTVDSMSARLAAGKELPPIAVRATPKGYEVIDGHHRLAAHQQAGSKSIPAKIVEPENIRRIHDPDVNWGYDKSSKDFLKPGFDPNPKKISYDKYMKDLAKQTKK